MSGKKKVVVVIAMSGGIDSSVAAALLVEQGYEVVGMMLRLWSEAGKECDNRCCTPESMSSARQVANLLEIPFYVIDAKDIFYKQVVRYFIDGYAQGITPNPCLICNNQIRWGFLLQHALSIGADYFATGHYARIIKNESGNNLLLKGIDPNKDQSYVLYHLNQDQLGRTILPLGNFHKSQVREMINKFQLPISQRTESQDLCFLGNQDYREFLIANNGENFNKPGPIKDVNNQVIGEHSGLYSYTIGQRKGLGVSSNHPMYVLQKDIRNNSLIVGDINQLGKNEIIVHKFNWINGPPANLPLQTNVKIRYRAKELPALVTSLKEDKVRINLFQQVNSISPGQAAVLYIDDNCLGGGLIES